MVTVVHRHRTLTESRMTEVRANMAHALDAGLRLYFLRVSLARASDADR